MERTEQIRKSFKRAGYLLEVLEKRRLLSAVSWTASSSGSWNTASNWSTGNVPVAGDDVIINHPGAIQVLLAGSASVNSVSVTGDTLTISGGILSVKANSIVGPSATLILNTATLALTSGATLTNSGSITVNPGSQLNDGGAYSESSTGTLTLPSGIVGSGVGTNLLGNPGFELPAAGSSTTTGPNNWGQWGSSYVSTLYHHGGSQSLLQSGSNSGVNQSFAVSPGVSYSASVFALTPVEAKLTGAQGGFVGVSFSNASGGSISSPSQFITVLNLNSLPGTWVNSTTSIIAPVGAASINFDMQVGAYVYGVTGTAGGSVYWDDIQLGPTAINPAIVSTASLNNSGSITIGAGDTVGSTGTFTQTPTGILNLQLGGPAAGNFYGSLTASGIASLAGTLKAATVNGYAPTLNDGFTLLSYAGEVGSFGTYQLPTGATYAFQAGVNPTYVGISAVPFNLSTTINVPTKIATATNNLVGVNLAYWDSYLTSTQTQQMVKAAGLSLLRFPGGSGSDDYHFNIQNNYGYSSITVPQFAKFISAVGATGMVTADYGSGSPQEAEAELAYLEGSTSDTTSIGTGIEWSDTSGAWQNVNWETVSYWANLRVAQPLGTDDGLNFLRINQAAPYSNIKYWEMGNEIYYNWETDHHGTAGPGGVSTGAQHDAATYAAFAASFSNFVSADPNFASVVTGIDNASPDGSVDNYLMKTVVTDLHNDGAIPGFISDHVYMQGPGSENDSFLLNSTVSSPTSILGWSTRHAEYEAMLQQVLGASSSSVKLMATEFNSNYGTEGKQMTSIVNGLFVADSIGSLLNSGYSAGLVWDLRNGWNSGGNNSPTLYGWRQGGDEGLIGTYNSVGAPSTGPYVPYPGYFAEQLASKVMQSGGSDVSTTSSYDRLAVYSVMEPNGHLELMVLNKNPQATLTNQFNLSGFIPSGQAQIWQYGEAQDYAQSQSVNGASALGNSSVVLSLAGNNFSYAFPAYSMTVIDLTPKLTVSTAAVAIPNVGIVGTPISLRTLGLENGGDSGLTYTWSATGPASVTYTGTINGTNSAKNISANFSQAGTYSFLVTITDLGGQSISSSVPATVLPLFASQIGSTLTISLNNVAPIFLATSGSNIVATEAGYSLPFTGVAGITVNGSATNNILNFSGPLSTPFNFINGATTTLNVNNGTLTIAGGSGSFINTQLFSTINLAGGASLFVASGTSPGGRTLLSTQYLTLTGSAGLWTSKLDLNNNDLEVRNGVLSNINDQIKQGYNLANGGNWQGSGGIVSSAAAGDTTHLTALGVILNTVDGTPGGSALYGSGNPFDGTSPPTTAILIKYTYYGDANLDGQVDGSDYTRIDNGYLHAITGWFNGDFNYDTLIDGSDYTLIDNAFNGQGAVFSSQLAATNNLSQAPVPIPTPAVATAAPFSISSVIAMSNPPGGRKELSDSTIPGVWSSLSAANDPASDILIDRRSDHRERLAASYFRG